MSDSEIIAGLVAVVVLSAYLLLRHCRRVVCRPQVLDPALWSGRTIDVSMLKPKVEAVRFDYITQPPRGERFHLGLLALARRTVAQLAYFQAKRSEGHPHCHCP